MSTSPDATAIRRRDHVLGLSRPAGGAALTRVSANLYRLAYNSGGQQWSRVDLLASSAMSTPPPGGFTLLQLNQAAVDLPWLSVDHTDASVTHSGAGWLGDTAQAASYGGSYRQNNTGTGQYVEWTTPAAVTRVGVRTVAATNEGIHLVTIDGSTTAANLLPTAQDLVTLGRLASTALVANGGTLNPTDRVLDLYVGSSSPGTVIDYDRHFALADGLASGVHTVRVTITGYSNVSAGANWRLYTSGFTYGTATTTRATAGAEMLNVRRVLSQFDSAWEGADEFAVPAGSNYVLVGNVHGYESPVSLTFYLDGEVVTLTDGQTVTGSEITAVRVSELRHPDTTTTKHADKTVVYRVGGNGLTVEHKTTWATACKVRKSYPAMLPLNGDVFTAGSFTDAAVDYTLTANDGTFVGKAKTDTAYAWNPTGKLAAALHLPDLIGTVGNWADASADIYCSIEDRVPQNVNSGNLSKVYMTRIGALGPVQTMTVGQVWRAKAVYRWWQAQNVNDALAR